MAHVMLTVSRFAAARAFYGRLLPALGMTPVCDTDKLFYCVSARTAIGIQPAWRMTAIASFKAGLACTISAYVPDRAMTLIDSMLCCRTWAPLSSRPPRRALGRRAITRCCSKTRTAFAWRQTSSLARACSNQACLLTQLRAKPGKTAKSVYPGRCSRQRGSAPSRETFPDFIHSDYCTEKEMQRAFARAKKGQCKVAAVILEPCQRRNIPIDRGGSLANFWQRLAMPSR
jgi:hypothetical protein